jgi:hypothetical protein
LTSASCGGIRNIAVRARRLRTTAANGRCAIAADPNGAWNGRHGRLPADVAAPTLEQFTALQQALAEALKHNETLAGELRVTRTERDLLKEQLNKFKRQLFAASSEVTGQHQKDMFFNEAESLGSAGRAGGRRAWRRQRRRQGRRAGPQARQAWAQAAGPRTAARGVRHELPEGERVCPHDGAALARSAWRPANNWTSSRSRCA